MTLAVLDLFSGIGGFSLGLDRATRPDGQPGFRTVAFCEQNAYATAVLKRHWPGVPIYGDVCQIGAASLATDGIGRVDVVCGGFPCQDISLAGKGAGLDGDRSGLWFEMLRIINETRPRFVIAENVSALRSRGLDVVLRGLASIGYDAEWHCIPASAVGAPHRRDRVWIIAHPEHARGGSQVADADSTGQPIVCRLPISARTGGLTASSAGGGWITEPDVGRVAHGVPSRVDRLRCLGNAVVPQIPEMIGRAILASIHTDWRTDPHAHNVSVSETYNP